MITDFRTFDIVNGNKVIAEFMCFDSVEGADFPKYNESVELMIGVVDKIKKMEADHIGSWFDFMHLPKEVDIDNLEDFFNYCYEYALHQKYNAGRRLSSFEREVRLLRNEGFDVIGVTQMYFEDVFIFRTKEEAEAAYQKMEVESRSVIGFFESLNEFEEGRIEYEKGSDTKVNIYWL